MGLDRPTVIRIGRKKKYIYIYKEEIGLPWWKVVNSPYFHFSGQGLIPGPPCQGSSKCQAAKRRKE